MKVSIVIPCYGSEKTIKKITEESVDILKQYEDYEIILVNDSSPDNVWNEIKEICKTNKKIKGINLSKNFGQHSALMAGYQYVTGDIIVSMDDDGQTSPSYIPVLVNAIDDNTDVVYAKYKLKKHNKFRNFGSKINFKMTEWLLNKPKELFVSSFFASKKYVIKEILKYKGSYPYVLGLILRTTNKIKNVDVAHNERITGKSGYSFKKLISLWLNGFTAFSIKPLRIADLLGILTSLSGFIYMIVLIIRRIIIGYSAVAGWHSLISVILFVGGVIMCILGVIGEYLGRIYICNNNSPQYVIREAENINLGE